jgi:hypothetical protein
MATIVPKEEEGSIHYRQHTAPAWCGYKGAQEPIYFRKFLGRVDEDLRVYDALTRIFKKVDGPSVEIPLFLMTKNAYNIMKAEAAGLSGVVFTYKVKDKDSHKEIAKKNPELGTDFVIGGALWVPG